MGDVMKIKSIAEELKSESDTVAPFCDELIRLTDDFDFDGIQKIVLELDNWTTTVWKTVGSLIGWSRLKIKGWFLFYIGS